jgi:predicted helicase
MITNNSYIDGLIHRQMRKHLLQTFDKIYVIDLHGNSKKKETSPDGGKDENVFDIMQGVSIVVMVKTGGKQASELAKVQFAELYGRRNDKYDTLGDELVFRELTPEQPRYYLVAKDTKLADEYSQFVSLRDLMPFGDAGIKTHRDNFP